MNASEPKKNYRSRILRTALPIAFLVIMFVCFAVVVISVIGPAEGHVFSNIVNSISADDAKNSGSLRGLAVQDIQHVIIRQGDIILTVDDTRGTKAAVKGMVAEMESEGAFIVNDEERIEDNSEMPTVSMTIRVPAARFDEVMDRLAAMAVKVEERMETAEDVTEEYVDLQGRIKSMEETRDRLREIMNGAATVEDLLLAEKNLAEREAELEALKGRLEFLTKSAQLSKITILLNPSDLNQPVGGSWRPGETVQRAFSGLIWSIKGAINLLIYIVIVILPWVVVIGLIALCVRFVRRKFFPKSMKNESLDVSSKK